MEKVKAFVIKYQLWFKLAAIALLVCTIFTPFYIMVVDGEIWQNYSIWYYATKNAYIDYVRPFTIIALILSMFTIILLGIGIVFKNKKILIASLLFYLLSFILVTITVACVCSDLNDAINSKGFCTPHIAFYLSLILLIADILTLWQIQIMRNRKDG